MLFLLNGDGTMTRLDSGRIFQGSNNFTELGIIYPYQGVTLSVAFTLSNGIDTKYTPLPPLKPYTLKGNNGETKVFENLYYTSTRIPSSVTAMQGSVKVTVLATAAAEVTTVDNEGRLTTEEQAVLCTSYAATFTVEYAALPVYTVPDDPTEADFQKLVELLTAYQAALTVELNNKQDIESDDLNTVDKTIVGAINEVYDEVTGDISSLEKRMTAAETDIDNLQSDMSTAEGDISSLETRMADAEDDINTAQSNITALQNDKQDKTDSSLDTADKTVVGAINEIYEELTQGGGVNSRLDTLEAELNVLDSRVEDVEEKTAQPLMTDFTVDVDAATATKFYNNGDSSTIPLPAGGGTGGGGGVSTFSFAEATWVQQTDGTYTLTLTATQTGKSNNNYTALVAAADGTGFSLLAIAVIINTDGSLYIEGVTTPFAGRVTIIG